MLQAVPLTVSPVSLVAVSPASLLAARDIDTAARDIDTDHTAQSLDVENPALETDTPPQEREWGLEQELALAACSLCRDPSQEQYYPNLLACGCTD